jgi:hypothetical protein
MNTNSNDENTKQSQLLAAEIYSLAKHIAHSEEDDDVSTSIDALEEHIYDCIVQQDELTLITALEAAISADDEEAVHEINNTMEIEASCAELEESTITNPATAHLFAIPIILELSLSGFSSVIKDVIALSELEQSIMESGIFDGSPDVTLINYMYTPDELNTLSPCDVFKISKNTAKEMRTKSAKRAEILYQEGAKTTTVETMHQTNVPGAAKIDRNLVTRYLVGVAIDRSHTDPFETAYDSDRDSKEFNDQRTSMLQWQTYAVDLLNKCLMNEFNEKELLVGEVDTFYEARRCGTDDYKNHIMLLQMDDALAAKEVTTTALRALVAPFGNEVGIEEIRISLISLLNGELVAGLVYEMSDGDDFESTVNVIALLLDRNDIFSIDIVNDLQIINENESNFQDAFLQNHATVRSVLETMDSPSTRTLH